jgi:hypothetical protein
VLSNVLRVPSEAREQNPRVDSGLVERLDVIRSSLDRARAGWGERGEITLETGLTFDGRRPIEARVRKRGRRYDIGDEASAVSAAGKPPGWLRVAERIVADVGLNVNRRGVVFVSAVEGRDIASLTLLVADTSLAVYTALLESEEGPTPQ